MSQLKDNVFVLVFMMRLTFLEKDSKSIKKKTKIKKTAK